jgi:hypothetical protein
MEVGVVDICCVGMRAFAPWRKLDWQGGGLGWSESIAILSQTALVKWWIVDWSSDIPLTILHCFL